MHTIKVLKPKPRDVSQMLILVSSDAEHLIPRTKSEIRKKLSFWRIIRVNRTIVACGCFERYSRRMAEIRSFIVQPEFRGRGYGKAILQELLTLAQPGQRVFVVTSLPDFFKKQSFSECLQEKYILFYH
jgi:amino-acid N-acetyltransferase